MQKVSQISCRASPDYRTANGSASHEAEELATMCIMLLSHPALGPLSSWQQTSRSWTPSHHVLNGIPGLFSIFIHSSKCQRKSEAAELSCCLSLVSSLNVAFTLLKHFFHRFVFPTETAIQALHTHEHTHYSNMYVMCI